MTQLAIRIDDDLIAGLDELIKNNEFATRSEGIRAALKLLLDQQRRASNARREVDAYTKFPEADDELAGLAEFATAKMIEEEPW